MMCGWHCSLSKHLAFIHTDMCKLRRFHFNVAIGNIRTCIFVKIHCSVERKRNLTEYEDSKVDNRYLLDFRFLFFFLSMINVSTA